MWKLRVCISRVSVSWQLLFVSPTSSKWLRVTQTAVANCYGGDGGHHNACLLPCCSTQDPKLVMPP